MIRSVDFQLFPVSYPDGRFDMHTRANNCINVTKTTRLWPSSRESIERKLSYWKNMGEFSLGFWCYLTISDIYTYIKWWFLKRKVPASRNQLNWKSYKFGHKFARRIIQHFLLFFCIGIYYELVVHPINIDLNEFLFLQFDPQILPLSGFLVFHLRQSYPFEERCVVPTWVAALGAALIP